MVNLWSFAEAKVHGCLVVDEHEEFRPDENDSDAAGIWHTLPQRFCCVSTFCMINHARIIHVMHM